MKGRYSITMRDNSEGGYFSHSSDEAIGIETVLYPMLVED